MNTSHAQNNELAHPAKRYQGQFVDGLIAIGLFFLLIYLFRALAFENSFSGAVTIAIPVCYFVFSDALPNGQSIGKKPFGLYVVSQTTGKPCSLLQAFLRNAFSPILGLIDAVLIFGKGRQRLGDKFAGTIVIKK